MPTVRIGLDEIVGHFDDLEDPRSEINRKHPFPSVVVIALMAVLAGAGGPTAIARWAKHKAAFLQGVLDLPGGVPCKDVFRRVLCLVNPSAFQACFAAWLTSLREAAEGRSGVDTPIFAVDGKTARRSHDRSKGLGALHSVSVWASDYGLSLGQVACADKSNEITAIPELLRLVDIKGSIVTIDAMGTQKAIAAQIVQQGADYVLALKGNQGTLHDAVVAHVDEHMKNDFADLEVLRHTTTEKSHGRETTRCYFQMRVPAGLAGAESWKELKTIGVAVSACVRDGQETVETRYYLCSLAMGVRTFARAVRSHWGIENTCHWSLDTTFREDDSRIRDACVRENFAWLNRFVLSLLKQHPRKDSLVGKRQACGWNED
ncbi:MAG: ISAs1 family transposase, partial [Sphingobium sp.]